MYTIVQLENTENNGSHTYKCMVASNGTVHRSTVYSLNDAVDRVIATAKLLNDATITKRDITIVTPDAHAAPRKEKLESDTERRLNKLEREVEKLNDVIDNLHNVTTALTSSVDDLVYLKNRNIS